MAHDDLDRIENLLMEIRDLLKEKQESHRARHANSDLICMQCGCTLSGIWGQMIKENSSLPRLCSDCKRGRR